MRQFYASNFKPIWESSDNFLGKYADKQIDEPTQIHNKYKEHSRILGQLQTFIAKTVYTTDDLSDVFMAWLTAAVCNITQTNTKFS